MYLEREYNNMEKTRTRNWFITINPNAECYQQFENIINAENVVHYAFIKHKAENDSENDNHIHLCVEYKDAKTFTSIQNKFVGAHIEQMTYKNMSYQYLIHKNDSDKTQYVIDDVITDDKEYFINMLDSDEYIKIDYDTLLDELQKGNNTIIGLTKVFGFYQVKNNLSMIKAFIADSQFLADMDLLKQQYNEVVHHCSDIALERDTLKDELDNALQEIENLKKIIVDNNLLPF